MEKQIQPAKTTESLRGMISYKDVFIIYIYVYFTVYFTCLTGPSFGLNVRNHCGYGTVVGLGVLSGELVEMKI